LNSLEEKITAHFGTIYLISFTKSSLRSSAMRVKFSQTYKKNNFFIWGRLFSSSSLSFLTPLFFSFSRHENRA